MELLLVEQDLRDYMENRLDEQQIVALFQTLLNNGLMGELPEVFHRRAVALARAGYVTLPS